MNEHELSKLSFIKRTLYQSPYFIHSMFLAFNRIYKYAFLPFWFSSISYIQALGVPIFCFLPVVTIPNAHGWNCFAGENSVASSLHFCMKTKGLSPFPFSISVFKK